MGTDIKEKIEVEYLEFSIEELKCLKNYLFAGSHEVVHQAVVVYSQLAICKINNVEPMDWLIQMLSVISNSPANKLHKLLHEQK